MKTLKVIYNGIEIEVVPKENYEALKNINTQCENRLEKFYRENEKLKGQIEILKKFSLIGEMLNEKEHLWFERYENRGICNSIPSSK